MGNPHRRLWGAAVGVALVIALPASAAGPARTTLVSKTSTGAPANGTSSVPSISASGRFVAFQSEATNLPGRDAVPDIYVRDRRTGKTRLVSKNSAGSPSNAFSFAPSISASGRFVAFQSAGTNLPGVDAAEDAYVHDRRKQKTRLVSKNSAGTPANTGGTVPSISASGRFVAFDSEATNLPGDDPVNDVYVHDRQTRTTRLVSKTSSGVPANGDSFSNSISASGRFVAFESNATNLPGDDTVNDVYVHDRRTGKTRLVSKTPAGTPVAGGDSFAPSISASGRFVAFQSNATDLPGDDAVPDIYVRDRKRGRTRLVSKTSGGIPANGNSFGASISASGRQVAFGSSATNLPGNDAAEDVYLHHRRSGKTRLISRTSAGAAANSGSGFPSIFSGRFVAFHSAATNFPGDDAVQDVYVRGPIGRR